MGIVLSGAAEQMFFFDLPLAHIAAYETWRRDERSRRDFWRQTRTARRSRRELDFSID